MYQSIHVNKGQGGWGVGLDITPSEPRTKVVSITGGGIHPVALKLPNYLELKPWMVLKIQFQKKK